MRSRLRSIFAVLLLAALSAGSPALAADPPMLRFELRVGSGVNVDTPAAARAIPVSFGVGGEHAFMAEPWTSVYGHIFVEGREQFVGGLAGGLLVHTAGGAVRLGGGGTALIGPTTLAGVTTTIGGCFREALPMLCVDLEGSLFFLGNGVPPGGSGQVKLILGIGFDVL